jgi:hypothetical protein
MQHKNLHAQHSSNIRTRASLKVGELIEKATCNQSLQVQTEGIVQSNAM